MKHRNLYLTLLSAFLLWLGWPPDKWTPILWIAFVPYLLMEDHFQTGKTKHFWLFTWLFTLVWNALTTWWVCLASLGGGIAAIIANSLLMTLPLLLFHVMRKRNGDFWGYATLISAWTAFEYFHLRWDLSWPWLNIGNAWAAYPAWIQWYEWTGTLGGTAWTLGVNIAAFRLWITLRNQGLTPNIWKKSMWVDMIIGIPILVSLLIRPGIPADSHGNALVIQPNIDPYNEKFNGIPSTEQIRRMLVLAEKKMDSSVRMLIFPETAITSNMEDIDIENAEEVQYIRDFQRRFPQCAVVIGASLYHLFPEGTPNIPATARYRQSAHDYLDFYNSALFIVPQKPIEFYHKSRLVPGVEKMPYPKLFGFLEKLTIDMGGVSGSLGTMPESKVFNSPSWPGVAPIICYESIYGEYISSFVKKGASVLCIITNDGWWGNTAGYKQHYDYAVLRAIETRRPVLRSANTGISTIISPDGTYWEFTKWWEPASIRGPIFQSNTNTIYTKWGDWPGMLAWILLPVCIFFPLRRKSS